jgi:hypothetical protein
VWTKLDWFQQTFLVRVRFFERPSFVRVTSPNNEDERDDAMTQSQHCRTAKPMIFQNLHLLRTVDNGISLETFEITGRELVVGKPCLI